MPNSKGDTARSNGYIENQKVQVVLALQAQQIHVDIDLNAEPHNRAIETNHYHTLLIANVQYGNEIQSWKVWSLI
jgi:hypothetical protein